MARAKTAEDQQIAAAPRREPADARSGTDDGSQPWRRCDRKSCRRRRVCGNDGEGRGGCSGSQAADKPKRLVIDFGFGKPATYDVDEAGKWTLIDGPRLPGDPEP
jgi:hypothetical protein